MPQQKFSGSFKKRVYSNVLVFWNNVTESMKSHMLHHSITERGHLIKPKVKVEMQESRGVSSSAVFDYSAPFH